jgi:hypothetical protein
VIFGCPLLFLIACTWVVWWLIRHFRAQEPGRYREPDPPYPDPPAPAARPDKPEEPHPDK